MSDEKYFLQFFRQSPLPALLLQQREEKFLISSANEAWLKHFETTAKQLEGKEIFSCEPYHDFHEDSIEINAITVSLAHVATSAKPHKPPPVLIRRHPQATEISESLQAENIPLLDDAGNVDYIIHFATITGAGNDQLQWAAEWQKNADRLALVEKTTNTGHWELDILTGSLAWSDQLFKICGYEPRSFVPAVEAAYMSTHPHDRDRGLADFQNAITTGNSYKSSIRLVRPDNEIVYVVSHGVVLKDKHDKPQKIVGLLQDVTQDKIAEQKTQQVNRLYAFISQLSQAVVRIDDEVILYEEVCRIAVEAGRFNLAWIGRINAENRTIKLAASEGLPHEKKIPFEGFTYTAGGPTEKMVNGLNYFVVTDIEKALGTRWKQLADELGLTSFITLAIKKNGELSGTLNIFSSDQNAFKSDEIKLLEIASKDLSFALEALEKDKQREAAELLLKHSELRLRQSQNIAHLGSWEFDFATGNCTWSQEMCNIYGLSPDNNRHSSQAWLDFIPAEEIDYVKEVLKEADDKLVGCSFHHRIVLADGSTKNIFCQTHFDFDETGKAVGSYGTSLDITASKEAEHKLVIANRLYAFTSRINQAIIHSKSEQLLLNECCEIALAFGKFNLALIGTTLADGRIKLCASKGMLERDAALFSDFSYEPGGPIETVVKGKDYAVIANFQTEINSIWNTYALKYGISSFICLPIKKSGKIFGIFNIYSAEEHVFTDEEILLLREVAANISYAIDVLESDRQRTSAELKLKQSESKLKQAQSIAKLGSWEVDIATGIVTASAEACKIYDIGLDEGFFTTEEWRATMHPEDAEKAISTFSEAAKTSSHAVLNHRIVKKDGSIRHLHTYGEYNFNREGVPVGIYGVCHDVTDYKETEIALLDSQKDLLSLVNFNQNLINASSLGIASYNVKTGKCSSANKAFADAVGGKMEDVLKQNFTEIKAWKSSTLLADAEATIASGDQHSNLVFLNTSFGKHAWLDYKFLLFYDKNEPQLLLLVQDVTGKKQAELLLMRSESNLKAIIENTDAVIYSIDPDFRYITFNEKLVSTLKAAYGIDVKPGDKVFDFLEKSDPDDLDNWRSIYTIALGGEIVKFEREFCVGTFYSYTDFSIHPIWENGNVIGLSCYVLDITRQKAAEREKQKIEQEMINLNGELQQHIKKLDISNQELEQFAYVASHDLQEPLRMVSSFLTQIDKKYSQYFDEKGKQYMHFALDGAKRMRQMILDLLEFSRTGRNAGSHQSIDLNILVHDVVATFQTEVDEKHAIIIVHELPVIDANNTALTQVFQNLVGNSLKYCSENTAPEILIDATEIPGYWQFSVQDNGIGIDAEYFEKIFVIFQRLHGRDSYSGTGIGLAITKKIIENKGGKIWVESEQGKGARFCFTIPKNKR